MRLLVGRGSLLVVLLWIAACSKSPQASLEAGTRFAKDGKHREAIIEFRNAVQKDPAMADAYAKMGDSYAQVGDGQKALDSLARAADLKPRDIDAQLKSGGLLLMAGRYQDARARADKALAIEPKNVDAIVLQANALAGLKDLDSAVTQLESAIGLEPRAGSYANLGALQMVRGRTDEAEAAFRKAIDVDPKSVAGHLALANFCWSTGRIKEAETYLTKAHALEPDAERTNRPLAVFYMGSGRAAEAEPYLKRIADASPRIRPKLELADYYMASRRSEEAVKVLLALSKQPQGWPVSQIRLSMIRFDEGRRPEAATMIDAVLEKEPQHVEALLTKARMLIVQGQSDAAATQVAAALKVEPQNVGAHYLAGTVHAVKGEIDQAVTSFGEVLRLNPRAAAAQMQLARLELARGAPATSVQLAEQAVKNDPTNAAAVLMLSRAHLAARNLDQAATELKKLETAFPDAAPVHTQRGQLALVQGERGAARTAFEKAIALDPRSVDALSGLVALDVAEKNVKPARARVDTRLAETPADSAVLVLGARAALADRDVAAAEALLRKAVAADPRNFAAYGLLGQLYLSQKKLDAALVEFEALAARQPRPVAAETMAGIIHQAQGRTEQARERYEKAVRLDPRAAVAANNLAWLYAEQMKHLDTALQLAQSAKAEMPEMAEVNDTLGFVYLQKKLPYLAIAPLREAVQREPRNPVYQYRLGRAYAEAGQSEKAKEALTRALAMGVDFGGADEARRILQGLPVVGPAPR